MTTLDTIARIEGSIDSGGWTATGAVFNDADRLDFYQEVEAWYYLHTTDGWEALPRPAFDHHLLPDQWMRHFNHSEAPFSSFTAQEFMKRAEIQGIFYKHVASAPANRHQIINMKLAMIVYEIFSGHSNLMEAGEASTYDTQLWSGSITTQTHEEGFVLLDLDITNSSTIDEYEVKAGGFWQRLKEIADIEFYQIYFDKNNILHYVPHPMFDATLPTATITLTNSLLLSPLTIDRRHTEQVGQVQINGTTPQGLQITGKYPTDPTAGPILYKSGYLSDSASLMNTIAERMYKFQNRDYTVTAELSGAVGLMLDLNDRVAITYTSSDDGITWSSKNFWVSAITVEILSNFNAKTILVLDAENA